ncbi:MAG TPA: ABC transporter permease, partial [Rhodocyclaceae bacterium]|nr:ABC transporter permease [Rhodocyclaceae bacterium]
MRGEVRIASTRSAPDAPAGRVPAPGQIWIDERLAAALGANAGQTLAVGKAILQIEAILTLEPDRGVNFFSVAPRLMMNIEDLPATQLIQTGSRVTYRLLLGGEPEGIESFRRWVESHLARGERVEDARNGRPEIRTALERAQRFLGLATLLTVVLAAVAVALASRRYMERHLDACAVMRCFGATQGRLIQLHLLQFLLLSAWAAVLGCLLGYVAHFALHAWLASLLSTNLPAPSLLPAGQGMLTAAILLFGFAFPPLLRLARVPTLRVIRRELGAPQAAFLGGYAIGVAMLAALMFWVAGDVRLGSYAVAGFAGAALVFTLLARGAVRLSGLARSAGRFGWRQGLASLERHAWASTVQIVALALGLLAMLLLTVTRTELLSAWQRATPPDAPNRFVVNIQPEQVKPLSDALHAGEISMEPAPMVRGRLLRINAKPVGPDDFP